MHEEILIRLLKDQGITLAASLPCDKAKDLFSLLPESFETIELLREEDGVGVCAGAYLPGRKPAMFIQSSGLGNMLNALLSLSRTYELPLPVIASWRGVYQEPSRHRFRSMQPCPGFLRLLTSRLVSFINRMSLNRISGMIDTAFRCHTPTVALISPQCWEGNPSCEQEEQIQTGRERYAWSMNEPSLPRQ